MDTITTKNKPLIEAIKEPSRYVVIAIVSYLLTDGVLEGLLTYFTGNTLEPQAKLIVISLITAVIRGIDKWLFETQKIKAESTKTDLPNYKGLTGF